MARFIPIVSCLVGAIGWLACAGLVSARAQADPEPKLKSSWAVHDWHSEDGLPNNGVIGFAQTSDGFLWVTTLIGLARFDGVRFEKFDLGRIAGDHYLGPRKLLASRNGGLWATVDYGPAIFLNRNATTVYSTGLPKSISQALVEDGEGAAWIAYRDGTVCRIKDGSVTAFSARDGLPDGTDCGLAVDGEGRLWFSKGGRIGVFRNGKFEILLRLGGSRTLIQGAKTGGVWICSDTNLYRCTEDKLESHGSMQRESVQSEIENMQPSELLEDRDGAVWVGTVADGLFRYQNSQFENVPVSHSRILSLGEDREGDIWVGTGGGGLNRIQPRVVALEGEDQGLPLEGIQSLCEDASGGIWATTQSGLLARRTADGWKIVPTGARKATDRATSMVADASGNVWIGTWSRVLYCWRAGQFLNFDAGGSLSPGAAHALQVSKSGDLWIGRTSSMLQRFRGGQVSTFRYPEDIRVFRASAAEADGTLWFGTSGGTLLKICGDEITDATPSDPPRSIRSLHVSEDGTLWIGYAGQGLGRLKNGRHAIISTEQGLFDKAISQVVSDGRGWLWFGADRGIFKVRQQELDDVAEGRADHVQSVYYGRNHGLPNVQASFGDSPGALRSRDGRIWIPACTGVAIIDPSVATESLEPPPVVIESVAVDDRILAVNDSVMPVHDAIDLQEPGAALRLPPQHRRLQFDFTALSYRAPENIHFWYRLDGYDDDWTEAGVERIASYSRLPAGSYRFQIQARSGDGVWKEAATALGFVVTPFVWQTWWFRSIALIAFTTAVVLVARYISFRRLRLTLQALERQTALDRDRARIARNLHDDLGADLTEVGLLTRLAADDATSVTALKETVARVSERVRGMARSLDAIVWAVNPTNDSLDRLASYISSFFLEHLKLTSIRGRLDVPGEIPAIPLTPDQRSHIFLTFKEAMNNAIKHSGATEVWLRIRMEGESFLLSMEDNGRGFDPGSAGSKHRNGLRNMRSRIEALNGTFSVDSAPHKGTVVSISLRFTPAETR